MLVAFHDLRFAKGRFALMGATVALLTLLVVMLSGLTAGLARDSASAVSDLPAERLVFAAPPAGEAVSFTASALDAATVRAWAAVPGVRRADPLGVATAKAVAPGGRAVVTVFGVAPGAGLAPAEERLTAARPGAAADAGRRPRGRVVLSSGAAAALRAEVGATVRLSGRPATVAAVAGAASHSHTPVVWTSLAEWRALAPPGSGAATALALDAGPRADLAAADRRLGTATVTRAAARDAIPSYRSERTSLELMRALLLAISALVVGAFFTVWTIQRSREAAVLAALGAAPRRLLADALAQALALLVASTALGAGAALAAGAAAARRVPFALDAATVLAPAAALVALGLLGAALATRRVVAADPLTALGAAR